MSDDTATKAPRTVRTPQQRAQDALGVANERVKQAEKARNAAQAAHAAAQAEYERLSALAVHASRHPDLNPPTLPLPS